ncbi:MAG: hypothetical protein MUF05_02530 [Candidatus Omnitrophica bacterium]|jgi:hypothetical protein|nr:hypothetical protein [Candidatus Omnitrophota bacterium]
MEDVLTVITALRVIFFWSSPLLFVIGVIIAVYSNYRILEEKLAQNIMPVKIKKILVVEKNIMTFHEWLLNKRVAIGILCIISSVVFFITLKS